eukprot:6577086-Prymnesium_polylepis.1
MSAMNTDARGTRAAPVRCVGAGEEPPPPAAPARRCFASRRSSHRQQSDVVGASTPVGAAAELAARTYCRSRPQASGHDTGRRSGTLQPPRRALPSIVPKSSNNSSAMSTDGSRPVGMADSDGRPTHDWSMSR